LQKSAFNWKQIPFLHNIGSKTPEDPQPQNLPQERQGGIPGGSPRLSQVQDGTKGRALEKQKEPR
jgi:hypothetical protein